MLFATATKKLNRLIAPSLLKHGLTLRFVLAGGTIRDNPYLDYALLLPLAQTLLSIEIQDIAKEQQLKEHEKKTKVPSAVDKFVDKMWNRYIEPNFTAAAAADDDGEEENNRPDNPRLDAFQEFLLPALNPTREWSDIERYRFNSRFIKWLRSEYLICKYGSDIRLALSQHTQLRVTPLLQKNAFKETIRQGMMPITMPIAGRRNKVDNTASTEGFAPLPNGLTLNKAFQMGDWNKEKLSHREYDHMTEIAKKLGGYMEAIPGSNVQIANVPIEASTEKLNFEEMLEVSGCHVSSCNAFNALCEEGGIYEFWTEEYVSGLADYLSSRCENFHGETVIVDLGAGDGCLSHFLQKYMKDFRSGTKKRRNEGPNLKHMRGKNKRAGSKNKISLPMMVATDDGSWKIDPKAEVEKLNVTEALKKYNAFDESGKRNHQLITICSWMPMGVDWTKEMRDSGVDEYILIGECDDGNCGENWLTFGNPEFKDDIYLDETESQAIKPSVIAPYKMDGFTRTDLDDLSVLQYSRFDSCLSGSSKTISFRRS